MKALSRDVFSNISPFFHVPIFEFNVKASFLSLFPGSFNENGSNIHSINGRFIWLCHLHVERVQRAFHWTGTNRSYSRNIQGTNGKRNCNAFNNWFSWHLELLISYIYNYLRFKMLRIAFIIWLIIACLLMETMWVTIELVITVIRFFLKYF